MADNADNALLPSEPEVTELAQAGRWRPSTIWLVPLLAVLIGFGLVAKSVLDRGPAVIVSFRTADGLEPGKTKVKYKDVDIGLVRSIALAPNLETVQVTIDLSQQASRFAVDDTRFWVVRPRVGAGGVSGLGTLLSGAYIGVDAGKSGVPQLEFTGLEKPPQVAVNEKGSRYTLRGASLGSIDIGSPVFYRRMQVGQVTGFELDDKGPGVTISVFVNAPFDRYVGRDARWWHASGVDLRLDANGFKINTQSMTALLMGGIGFDNADGTVPAAAARPGSDFALADDQAGAMRAPDGARRSMVLYFDQSLRGLAPGAPVDFWGVVLGEVHSVGVEFDPIKKSFRMPVTVDLYPDRLGRQFQQAVAKDQTQGTQVLERLVARGLRGQLRTGNLLTGQLYVALDFFPHASPVTFDATRQTIEMPTVPNSLDALQTQVASIARKLDQVPFAAIGSDLRATLQSADSLLKRLDATVVPELADTLGAAHRTFGTADLLLQSDSPTQSELREALRQLTQTLQSLNALSDYLERHPESLVRGKQGKKGEPD